MVQGSNDLLARFRAGEAEAFEQLVSDLGPRLVGYFLRQGAQSSTAEDLTQNVFVRVLQSVDRYHERGSLEAYFLRIARNLWIDHGRRKRPVATAEGFEAEDLDLGPRERAERGDRAEAVREALRDLDPDTRELLEFAVLQRLPYREVSELLDIPVGTVKSRVYYALRRLRARVEFLDPNAGAA